MPDLLTYYRNNLNDLSGNQGGQGAASIAITSFSDTFIRADGDLGINWLCQVRDSKGGDYQWPHAVINNNKLLLQAQSGNPNNALNNRSWIPRQLISTDINTKLPNRIYGVNQFAQ